MRVVVDGRVIQDHFPGVGRYAFELTRALAARRPADELIVLIAADSSGRLDPTALAVAPNVSLVHVSGSVFSPRGLLGLGATIRGLRPDVLFAPYFLRPLVSGVPVVVTIHDLTPLDPAIPGYSRLQAAYLHWLIRLSARGAQRVLVPSEYVMADVIRRLGISASRLVVTPYGVDERFFASPSIESRAGPRASADAKRPDPYILFVGINKPHKNLVRLIRAYALAVGELGSAMPNLVLAGPEDRRYPEARQLAAQLELVDRVLFVGPVSDDDLPTLYRDALAFIFPSLAEGFGLPVVEAMASETPVAAARATSLPEVVGDAGLLFDPRSVGDIKRVLEQIASDHGLRARLGSRGHERARQYTWARTAELTASAFQAIAT